MKYATVCSGIEACSVAWHPLGWESQLFSEIEPFPCAVLKHHYPDVPNYGDMTKFKEWPDDELDLICGGTPCQSFSVAGLRKGLDDPRGNLMLTYLAIAGRYRPEWLVWENVPGVLSSNGGRDFASLLRGMAELGYGFAYRILDAQFFGVPQRRRRVFVVGCLGDWRHAAAVLFERHSLQGHPAPRREKGKGLAADFAPSLTASGRGVERTGETRGQDPVVAVESGQGFWRVGAGPLRAEGENRPSRPGHIVACFDRQSSGEWGTQPVASTVSARDYKSISDAVVVDTLPVAFESRFVRNGRGAPSDIVPPLKAQSGQSGKGDAAPLVAFGWQNSSKQGASASASQTPTLDKSKVPAVGGESMQVRRLTPRECERLQGFPDDYTLIQVRNKPASDGPRYKALGNSMAVPCMKWIGERINMVNSIKDGK